MIAGIGRQKQVVALCLGSACLALVLLFRLLGSENVVSLDTPATQRSAFSSHDESEFCAKLFDYHYFDSFTKTSLGICSNDSKSKISCYETHIALEDSRHDFFCFIDRVLAQADSAQLTADCSIEDLHFKSRLPKYMYDTTMQDGFDAIRLEANDYDARLASSCDSERTNLALVRREGAEHTWDCLLEIFSFFLTVELMRYHTLIAINEKVQVVFLDNHPDGPYSDLWSMFGHAPPIRMANLWDGGDMCVDRVILPLPGGSNPLFQGDWTRLDCQESTLVRDFRMKTEQYYGLESRTHRQADDQIYMTVIHRNRTRRLVDHAARVEGFSNRYPMVRIQEVDLATMDFPSQIRLIQGSDILVGVHGAGLTHILFLSATAVVVEILPANIDYEGFRNLARLQGVHYLRLHGQIVPQGTDWHAADILLPEDDFEDLLVTALDLVTERSASLTGMQSSL